MTVTSNARAPLLLLYSRSLNPIHTTQFLSRFWSHRWVVKVADKSPRMKINDSIPSGRLWELFRDPAHQGSHQRLTNASHASRQIFSQSEWRTGSRCWRYMWRVPWFFKTQATTMHVRDRPTYTCTQWSYISCIWLRQTKSECLSGSGQARSSPEFGQKDAAQAELCSLQLWCTLQRFPSPPAWCVYSFAGGHQRGGGSVGLTVSRLLCVYTIKRNGGWFGHQTY